MAVEYVREIKKTNANTSVARKIYSLRQLFKFLRKKSVTTADPFGDMELHAIRRKLPVTLTINEMCDCMAIFDGKKPEPIYRKIESLPTEQRSRLQRVVISLFRRADMRSMTAEKRTGRRTVSRENSTCRS
jgi:hypothetical protein